MLRVRRVGGTERVDTVSDETPTLSPEQVQVRDVWKLFPVKGGTVTALAEIDLDIRRGEFVAVLGPSGCGKSTLLNIIAGLEQPTRGSVEIDGDNITSPYTGAGIVFQRDLLFDWRDCVGNVVIQFEMRGESASKHRDRAHELLAMVGVDDFADEHPRRLSGGMRQRVSICRALAHDPQILLMDEPFGALDEFTREQLNLELARLSFEAGKSVLFITHSIPEAVFLGDRIIVMSPRPGQIIADHPVPSPRPRDRSFRESDDFHEHVRVIRDLFRAQGVG